MTLSDLKISGDTLYWSIILILLLGIVISYQLGYKAGVTDEKVSWLEQQELERKDNE